MIERQTELGTSLLPMSIKAISSHLNHIIIFILLKNSGFKLPKVPMKQRNHRNKKPQPYIATFSLD